MVDKIAKHLYNHCFFASRLLPFVPTQRFVVAAGREGLDMAGGGGRGVLQLRTMCYIEPVLAFGTEQDIIVNSRCLSSRCSQRSSQSEFDELHKECHLRKWYCLSEFENELSR
jgi:hypothetical protein